MPQRARGFTLVEVLVALVIVAFGMGAVLAALSGAADSATRLREKTFAAWVGFNQLATQRLQATLPSDGEQAGEVDFAGSRWHWQQTVAATDVPGLKRITIRVRHADSDAVGAAAPKGSLATEAWVATVMGFRGDAIQTPLDVVPNYDGAGGPNPPPAPGT